jgi:hypothetical protein
MATMAAPLRTDWRKEWFEIEDAVYLNTAMQSAMPKVAVRAVQEAIEGKKFPHRMSQVAHYEVPVRVRAAIAELIGAQPQEIALTTGASSGLSALAYGMAWKAGDEIVTAGGEFPLQYSTWRPMQEREGVELKIVKPSARFITADNLLAALSPKTRLVSVSMVRFDDGSLLDVAKIGAACHRQGALLAVDARSGYGYRRGLQVAAGPIRHGIFLDQLSGRPDFAAWSFLLAGYRWNGPPPLWFAESRRRQARGGFAAMGRGGNRQLPKSCGAGSFAETGGTDRRGDSGGAYARVD